MTSRKRKTPNRQLQSVADLTPDLYKQRDKLFPPVAPDSFDPRMKADEALNVDKRASLWEKTRGAILMVYMLGLEKAKRTPPAAAVTENLNILAADCEQLAVRLRTIDPDTLLRIQAIFPLAAGSFPVLSGADLYATSTAANLETMAAYCLTAAKAKKSRIYKSTELQTDTLVLLARAWQSVTGERPSRYREGGVCKFLEYVSGRCCPRFTVSDAMLKAVVERTRSRSSGA